MARAYGSFERAAHPAVLAEHWLSYTRQDHADFLAAKWISFCDGGEVFLDEDRVWKLQIDTYNTPEAKRFLKAHNARHLV